MSKYNRIILFCGFLLSSVAMFAQEGTPAETPNDPDVDPASIALGGYVYLLVAVAIGVAFYKMVNRSNISDAAK